jgi:hypothetical protein
MLASKVFPVAYKFFKGFLLDDLGFQSSPQAGLIRLKLGDCMLSCSVYVHAGFALHAIAA